MAEWPSLRLETLAAAPGGCVEHAHPGFTLLFAEAGEFHQVSEKDVGGERRTFVRPGMAYALLPGQRHHARWSGTLRTASLFLSDAFVTAVVEEAAPSARDVAVDGPIRCVDAARVCFEALSRAGRASPRSRLVAESAATLLLESMLSSANARWPRPQRSLRPLDPAMIERVTEYVDAEIGEDLSLAQLASVVGQSPTHFARTFRVATGQSPAAFVRTRRLERAKTALHSQGSAGRGVLLADLALELGFASQAHFTSVFRRHVGVAPGAYRRAFTGK